MSRVSCIVPAYNEGPRIGGVLQATADHPLIAEVLVVDDHSTDDTRDVVKTFDHVRLIALPHNTGKSSAVATGIAESAFDTILLLDADLTGLTRDLITDLLEPVLKNEADISISLRGNAPLPWRIIGLDYISGERVFSKRFVEPLLSDISKLNSFALEVFLNRTVIRERFRIAVVAWDEVASAMRHSSHSRLSFGINKDFLRMARLILKEITPFEAVWQIIMMLRLRTRTGRDNSY